MKSEQSTLLPISCIKSTEYSIHTRRCFITGEYCSQQTNIQKDRQKLHEKGEINAFVVMNFSSMSDVVYEARMKPFIEGLKKYLYLDKDGKRIACISSGSLKDKNDNSLSDDQILNSRNQVSHIHVHRADTNPVSNYIICNRICQQMQIADLIIVDVSVESANVFYEFGLATAFQKLILPICFSDSFYAEKLPKKLEELLRDDEFSHRKTTPHSFKCHGGFHNWNPLPQNLKHHIDCFPWRRKLYEHFGIRYAHQGDQVSYLAFSRATDDRFGFSDAQYRKFPYRDKKEEDGVEVGEIIYCWLRDNYNLSETTRAQHNTLVRYTMDGFLEGDQAGLCIVNFYNNIIRPMHEQYCFCGDRVAVLGQPNKIWDDPKDSKTGSSLLYNVSDLIRIGMDQATYMAERKRIKTGDYLMPAFPEPQNCEAINLSGEDIEAIKKQVKNHIRNRTIPLNPENPIYVTQYKDGIQRNLDDIFYGKKYVGSQGTDPRFSCMYHVMLDTMRYVNEIVVDLSSNSIQAMFWLGAAHGSDVYAVTVRHEMSEQEKSWSGRDSIEHDRPIFDIAGLWTAMLRYGEMDSFYKQLELIQQGIDQHARLKLPLTDLELYEEEVYRQLYHAAPYLKYGAESPLASAKYVFFQPTASPSEQILVGYSLDEVMSNHRINKIQSALAQKSHAESQALESYYRDRFWRQMLRDNQLHLFLPLNDTNGEYGPRLQVIKWDMDTVAELSHYLSKRKVIGKYQFDTLRKDEYYGKKDDGNKKDGNKKDGNKKDAQKENFICIGEDTHPLKSSTSTAESLAESLMNRSDLKLSQKISTVSRRMRKPDKLPHFAPYRGFFRAGAEKPFMEQYYPPECISCLSGPMGNQEGAFCANGCGLKDQTTKLSKVKECPYKDCLLSLHFDYKIVGEGKRILRAYANGWAAPSKQDATDDTSKSPQNSISSLEFHWNKSEECFTTDSMPIKALPDDFCASLNEQHFAISQDDYSAKSFNIQSVKPDSSGTKSVPDSTNAIGIHYSLPAQLLLWRQEQQADTASDNGQKEKRTEYKYQVSLIGVSGPATKALTALLVDEEQKGRIWGIEGTDLQKDIQKNLKRYLPLNTLQTDIRKEFYAKFVKMASTQNPAKPQSEKEAFHKVKQLSLMYLSTILPQYFLPFLSKSDERRIYHGLEAFLRSIDCQNTEEFEDAVSRYTDTFLETLKDLLSTFRGVEALYEVKVSAESQNNTDNRKIQEITLAQKTEGGDPPITCLYSKKETSNGKKARTPGDDPGGHHPNGR